jgi:hypothetical protein
VTDEVSNDFRRGLWFFLGGIFFVGVILIGHSWFGLWECRCGNTICSQMNETESVRWVETKLEYSESLCGAILQDKDNEINFLTGSCVRKSFYDDQMEQDWKALSKCEAELGNRSTELGGCVNALHAVGLNQSGGSSIDWKTLNQRYASCRVVSMQELNERQGVFCWDDRVGAVLRCGLMTNDTTGDKLLRCYDSGGEEVPGGAP